ncbi:MAG: hypothetical protein BWK80_57700 [Desulfobacteraceae bacterium IS3]|nr:MAG: hypothetical protein BWK80_57700 [Desulfobacteraceae bacterium IS3]
MSMKNKEGSGLFKGVLTAYVILVLHLLLVAGAGCIVLFFRGITQYMLWVLIGCSLLILFSGYLFYRRIRQEGRTMRETLHSPVFSGRSVEVSFLGGFASVKIGSPGNYAPALDARDTYEPFRQLEDPATVRFRELKELARLLENDLITREEYNQTKQELFGH